MIIPIMYNVTIYKNKNKNSNEYKILTMYIGGDTSM